MSSSVRVPESRYDILIVDDEVDICLLVEGLLQDEGFGARHATGAEDALAEVAARRPSLVLLDVWLQGSSEDGLEVLDRLRREHPSLPVLMMSGHGTIETAVAALKRGAYDFIEKPFKADRLILQIRHALEIARLKRENEELRVIAGADETLIGVSPVLNHIRQMIDKAAPTNSRLLIVGPPGTGKETVARVVHARSRRAEGPFETLSCVGRDSASLEADLFGAEDQNGVTVGAWERAHGGTLYLDEVARLPLDLQSKLVRALQDNAFTRRGGSSRIESNARVFASSAGDPRVACETGRLREDLFYRLGVVTLPLSPLAERQEDIQPLATHFLTRAAESAGLPVRSLGEDALAALRAYPWPGNARQLRNAMEWVVITTSLDRLREPVRTDDLPPDITVSAPTVALSDKGSELLALPLREAREMFERDYLLAQIARFGGNISRTATFIGMERSALHRKLKILEAHGANESDSAPALSDEPLDEEPPALPKEKVG